MSAGQLDFACDFTWFALHVAAEVTRVTLRTCLLTVSLTSCILGIDRALHFLRVTTHRDELRTFHCTASSGDVLVAKHFLQVSALG